MLRLSLQKLLTAFGFGVLIFLTSYSFAQQGEPPQYTEGSFLVKFFDGVSLEIDYTPQGYLKLGIEEIDSLNVRKFDHAMQQCGNNLNLYPDTLSQVYNYYVQFRIYLLHQANLSKARQIFNTLDQRFPDHQLTYLAALAIATAEGKSGISFRKGNIDASQNVGAEIPKVYNLFQNYPNPFNPVTTIKYHLPKSTKVKLEIYNILGQKVKTLVDAQQPADYYKIGWDGKNNHGRQVGSGFYIYRLIAEATDGSENFIKVKKMLLIQ